MSLIVVCAPTSLFCLGKGLEKFKYKSNELFSFCILIYFDEIYLILCKDTNCFKYFASLIIILFTLFITIFFF